MTTEHFAVRLQVYLWILEFLNVEREAELSYSSPVEPARKTFKTFKTLFFLPPPNPASYTRALTNYCVFTCCKLFAHRINSEAKYCMCCLIHFVCVCVCVNM